MSRRTPRGQIIELGGEPRINFLPPEIQDRKDARRRRRALFMLVVLVAVLCGIGYFYAAQYANQEQAALEAEQQTTLDLLAQQGQYSEATALAKRVKTSHDIAAVTTATEVLWRGYIEELTDALPSGVAVEQWSLVTLSALESATGPAGLFPVSASVTVDLQVTAKSFSSISTLMDNLAEVTGVEWVSLGTVTLSEDVYATSIQLTVNTDVYDLRFAEGWQPSEVGAPAPPTQDEEPEGDDMTGEADE